MKKVLTLVYVLATGAFAGYAVVAEQQPALFWMEQFAPHMGDTYPVVLIILLTWLTFLLPLVILLITIRIIRQKTEKPQNVDGSGVWIIRKRQLQSALVEIPIYVNEEKVGAINMGKIRFFEAPVGRSFLIAGKGLSASEPVEFLCGINEQRYFNLEIQQAGLVVKYVLFPVSAADAASTL